MWFGDLVTMEWWEGIWLNEAFATFMEVMCQNAFRPQWQVWVTFGSERDLALEIDGLPRDASGGIRSHLTGGHARDVRPPHLRKRRGGTAHAPSRYLGAETYRDGIRHYLRKHSYANTRTTDLWDAIEEVSVRRFVTS